MEFKGSLEQLIARVETAGIDGHWNDEGVFHEFVGDNGVILNWWPETSALTIEGKPESRPALEALFDGEAGTSSD